MQCLQCQYDNALNAKFCNQCGAPFAPVCSTCGHKNTADAKFCNQCGTSLIAPISATSSVHAVQQEAELERRFQASLSAVKWWLQRERRVTYRTLKHTLGLDDGLLEEVRRELAFKRLAIHEDGEGLVWIGESPAPASPGEAASSHPAPVETAGVPPATRLDPSPLAAPTAPETNGSTAAPKISPDDFSPDDEPVVVQEPTRNAPEAERRQLTVMFCDLVGSTGLSGTLDPEDLREVIRAYQQTAAEVIQQYQGHVAQYLGDGLLIYFGFPVAHEDDAQRAVYTGLGIPAAMAPLNRRLQAAYGVQLAVRIGIHTGPVVVGEMGGGGRHENLALGETPNIAARLEGLAQPNTAVLSPVTAQLVQRSFVLEELGSYDLKGVVEPMMLYTVIAPRTSDQANDAGGVTSRFDALVGRDEEIGLLLRRWEQSKDGLGQVVLLSGEAGIGKSSLVEGLRHHVRQAGFTRIAFRCSPYHTNSAFYPIIEQVQRALGWQPDDAVDTQLTKLEQALAGTSLPLEDAVPLLAALLSLPLPEDRYPALSVTPQQQRHQTQDVLVAWLLEEAEHHPVLAVWEDLHWADPSTLETLGLIIDQAPTATMLHVLTFRPEFEPPWPSRSHLTPLTLNHLERPQVEALVQRLAGGKRLPEDVVAHIVGKTDGVPLYVEELTKMLLASALLREEAEQYVLTGPLFSVAIPDTLQDSLMARLDQMNTAKEVAQLGSLLGREFAYDMLQALAWQDETTLQAALAQLVQAELLYQRGRPPRARYLFKHALIQDAAYASLLRSVRQRYHQQVAQLLEARFPEVVETQPELVAHHYTEAAQDKAALHHWQRAGQRAIERSTYVEAIVHLRQGLSVLMRLPETPERLQQELDLQVALGPALIATKGQAAPDVERAYNRARELCQQVGDTSQLFPALWGSFRSYHNRAELRKAHEVAEQLLTLAQQQRDPVHLLLGHWTLGISTRFLGEFVTARQHLDQGMVLYTSQKDRSLALHYGLDPGVACLSFAHQCLWFLGYPDQALRGLHDALTLAHELTHPYSVAYALVFALWQYQFRREVEVVYERAEALITLATEQGFAMWLAWATFFRGWALAMQGQGTEGREQMRQGLDAWRSTGAELARPWLLAQLAESYRHAQQIDEGLPILAEAMATTDNTGEHWYEAELHRLKGELLFKQTIPDEPHAEACFHQALSIAQSQQAKSWELRAATSLARLWQSQGKRQEAYDLLTPVYEWFTEGFDTADLQEAKALLAELSA